MTDAFFPMDSALSSGVGKAGPDSPWELSVESQSLFRGPGVGHFGNFSSSLRATSVSSDSCVLIRQQDCVRHGCPGWALPLN